MPPEGQTFPQDNLLKTIAEKSCPLFSVLPTVPHVRATLHTMGSRSQIRPADRYSMPAGSDLAPILCMQYQRLKSGKVQKRPEATGQTFLSESSETGKTIFFKKCRKRTHNIPGISRFR
jgi:hypothetical protein